MNIDQANFMFPQTIRLEIEKMSDQFDEYGLEREEDEEDVTDDMDLTYKPPQNPIKSRITKAVQRKKVSAKSSKAHAIENKMNDDSQSVSSKTGTIKKVKTNPKQSDDAAEKKKLALLLKNVECLWNKADKKFRNAQIRVATWMKIAKDVDVSGSFSSCTS